MRIGLKYITQLPKDFVQNSKSVYELAIIQGSINISKERVCYRSYLIRNTKGPVRNINGQKPIETNQVVIYKLEKLDSHCIVLASPYTKCYPNQDVRKINPSRI